MPINPITNVTHYPVEQSAESSEEQRRREHKRGGQKNESEEFKAKRPPEEETESLPASNEEAALSSQYVDTLRVIDLLSHRPIPKLQVKNPFARIKELTEFSDDKERKKINKTL